MVTLQGPGPRCETLDLDQTGRYSNKATPSAAITDKQGNNFTEFLKGKRALTAVAELHGHHPAKVDTHARAKRLPV